MTNKIILLLVLPLLLGAVSHPKKSVVRSKSIGVNLAETIEENDSLVLLTNPSKWVKGRQTVVLFDYTVAPGLSSTGQLKVTGKNYLTDHPGRREKAGPKENIADLKITMKAGDRIILCVDPATNVGSSTVFSYSVGTGRGAKIKASINFSEK